MKSKAIVLGGGASILILVLYIVLSSLIPPEKGLHILAELQFGYFLFSAVLGGGVAGYFSVKYPMSAGLLVGIFQVFLFFVLSDFNFNSGIPAMVYFINITLCALAATYFNRINIESRVTKSSK